MAKIKYTSWEAGMQKITLVNLLQKHAGLSLGEAKKIMDNIMRKEVQIVDVDNRDIAEALVRESIAIGANCEIIGGVTKDHLGL